MHPGVPPPKPDPPPGHLLTVDPGSARSGRGRLRAFLLWAAAAALGGGAGWAAAAALGWLLGMVLPGGTAGGPGVAGAVAAAAQGGLTGLGLGAAQALALRQWLRRYARCTDALLTDWPWFTAGGGALGAVAGHSLGLGLADGRTGEVALLAVGVGIGQWLTLRRFGPGFWWWLAVAPAGLAGGPALAMWWLGPEPAAPVLLLARAGGAGLAGIALLPRVWERARALELEVIMRPLPPICGFALWSMAQLRAEPEADGTAGPAADPPAPVEPPQQAKL